MSFPFSAIVGQEDLRTALLANAVSPAIGGVLVRGERGTAKTTAVRAIARLLPPIDVVAGCPYACDPREPAANCPAGPHHPDAPTERRPARVTELPVGASSDRLTGSLDLERALVEGVKAFEPGLLAEAHRGVLYVDEVNLLADHLVDLLLDAAALGTNYVEREGVSVRHPSRFLLVGTMNPEEGELRPQLLDRFGLSVDVRGTPDAAERAEIVRRRLAYEADPDAFAARFDPDERVSADAIAAARARLPSVRLPDRALDRIARACARLGVDGHRADIVTAKAALALAALDGQDEVGDEHVRRAALLALAHRRRRGPLDAPGVDPDEIDRALEDEDDGGDDDRPPPSARGAPPASSNGAADHGAPQSAGSRARGPAGERTDAPAGSFKAPALTVSGVGEGAAGRRSRARVAAGQPVGDKAQPGGGVSALATLRAAAPHQRARGRSGRGLVLRSDDLRHHLRQGREGNLVVFAVDASGSMGARRRMRIVKGAALALLLDAYQRRDRVALLSFRGERADVLLAPTSSVDAAARRLHSLPTGGRTPLALGIEGARQVVARERLRDPDRRALVVLVTDGRANSGGDRPQERAERAMVALAREARVVVVDSEQGPVRVGLGARLAALSEAALVPLDSLSVEPDRRAA